jgi:ATP-dependent Clp endopeptidase proteolytic subunit ClpP
MPKDVETTDPPELVAAKVKVLEAEVGKHKAETAKFKAESDQAAAEARLKVAEATEAEIELEVRQEKRGIEKTDNKYFHFYPFNDAVSGASVKSCIDQVTKWMRLDPGCDIEIQFNSPGGEVVVGLALFDFIQTVRAAGHHVTTSTIGYAASMAGILLQAGDRRVMGAESWLMLHEASFGAQGKTGEVEDRVEWIKRVQDRFLDIFAARCQNADPETATKALKKSQIKTKWTRTDFWVDSDEALAFGLVDEVRSFPFETTAA